MQAWVKTLKWTLASVSSGERPVPMRTTAPLGGCFCFKVHLLRLVYRGVYWLQIVFPEAWWIGTKEANPEENQLPLPDSLAGKMRHEGVSFDTQGPAGDISQCIYIYWSSLVCWLRLCQCVRDECCHAVLAAFEDDKQQAAAVRPAPCPHLRHGLQQIAGRWTAQSACEQIQDNLVKGLLLTGRAQAHLDYSKASAILSAGKRRARASLEPGADEEESDVEAEVPSSQVQFMTSCYAGASAKPSVVLPR